MRVKILVLFFLVVCLLSMGHLIDPLNVKTTQAQTNVTSTYRIIATLGNVTPIISDLTPDKFEFETNYVFSISFFNQGDMAESFIVSQGALYWPTQGAEVDAIALSDSLNDSLTPIVRNDSILNPEGNLTLTPSSSYTQSLSLYTNASVIYDWQNSTYVFFMPRFTPLQPTTVELKVPEEFTVTGCSSGYVQRQETTFITYSWNLPPNQAFDLRAYFLPFITGPITTSFSFSADLSSVFPIKEDLVCSESEVIICASNFSVWTMNPSSLSAPIAFPYNASGVIVQDVSDGIGPCKETHIQILNPDNSSSGLYFVDYASNNVIVYPRYHYGGEFYEFLVEVTFLYQNPTSPIFPLKEPEQPYTYWINLAIGNITTHGKWRLNLTNIEMHFVLPLGTDPLVAQSGYPTLTFENGRPVANLLINAQNGSISGQWTVWFDDISLRDFYSYNEILSYLVFDLLFIVAVALWLSDLKSAFHSILGQSSISAVAISLFIYDSLSFINTSAISARQPIPLLFWGQLPLVALIIGFEFSIGARKKFKE